MLFHTLITCLLDNYGYCEKKLPVDQTRIIFDPINILLLSLVSNRFLIAFLFFTSFVRRAPKLKVLLSNISFSHFEMLVWLQTLSSRVYSLSSAMNF